MSRRVYLFAGIILAILLVQALVLYLFGQPLICACGAIKLWEGVAASSGNSQHLSDWYTFSHIIHGMLLYGGLSLFFPRMSTLQRLLIAVGVEVSWEIIENTPWLIERYRQQALAAGYSGDSIVNSLSDTLAMIGGFFIARKAPVWASIVAILGLEVWVGYSIRDNLTLNILNLVHPFDAIRAWQAGA